MAVAFQAVGSIAARTDGISPLTITAPACLADDTLVACVADADATTTIVPPGDWTQIVEGDSGFTASKFRYGLFWKKAASGDSAANFDFVVGPSLSGAWGVISAWRGAAVPDSPLDGTPGTEEASTNLQDNVPFDAYTPTTAAHIVYMAFVKQDNTAMSAAMSSDTDPDCTTRFDLETNVGADFTFACTSGDCTGAAITSRTWASNSTADGLTLGVVFGFAGAAVAANAFFENRHPIEHGMKPQTAAGMGGALIE